MNAKQLINQLKSIPKLIQMLEEDREATLSVVYGSQSYSDTRVQTSKTNAQEARTVAYLDQSDYMLKQIEQLHEERKSLLEYIHKVDDLNLVVVLFAIINNGTLTEAQDHLDVSRSTFFRLKREAMAKLDEVLNANE
ncbi:hypothetical protein JavanS250_0002 [Streptococcus satellite phage Javan250]|uniref:DUF1492 domain-containing protein n=1 Tax=Streptococcus halotolerans TaxID=1814128 RepID=UPI000788D552|nr:DUF1492 domain-containing protein [Streptococcus halotolerans]QBX08335.1 hypothetical protein JavanS250_0002 [Streptococcus satellite phage Javan250]